MKYYYLKNETLQGPFLLADLPKLITLDTLVRDETGDWKLAKDIPEIIAEMNMLNGVLSDNKHNPKTPPPLKTKTGIPIGSAPPPIKKNEIPILNKQTGNNNNPPPPNNFSEKINDKSASTQNLYQNTSKTKQQKTVTSPKKSKSILLLFLIAGIIGLILIISNKKSTEHESYKNDNTEQEDVDKSNNNSFNNDEDVDDNENTNKTICDDCNGTGKIEEHVCGCTHNVNCEEVKGGGFTYTYEYEGYKGCSRCNNCMGTGVVSEHNCMRCSGTGEEDVIRPEDRFNL